MSSRKQRKRIPTLTIGNSLTADDLAVAWEFLDRHEGQQVDIVFDSNGGTAEVGSELNKAFRSHGDCIATVYRAESAAAIALGGCRVKVGQPSCSVFLHKAFAVDINDNSTRTKIKLKQFNQLQVAMISRDTATPFAVVRNWFSGNNGKTFRGDEVCAAGFVDIMDNDDGLPRSLLVARGLTAGLQSGFIPKTMDNDSVRQAVRQRLRGQGPSKRNNRRAGFARLIK